MATGYIMYVLSLCVCRKAMLAELDMLARYCRLFLFVFLLTEMFLFLEGGRRAEKAISCH